MTRPISLPSLALFPRPTQRGVPIPRLARRLREGDVTDDFQNPPLVGDLKPHRVLVTPVVDAVEKGSRRLVDVDRTREPDTRISEPNASQAWKRDPTRKFDDCLNRLLDPHGLHRSR
jgi:hypothetical protein